MSDTESLNVNVSAPLPHPSTPEADESARQRAPVVTALQSHADALLRQMNLVPPREPRESLRPIDEATILELAAAGKSQTEIASLVGCHQSTVSRTLAEWADSRGLARKYAEAKSLEMMKRFVTEASPAEILKMQAKLDVVREDRAIGSESNFVVVFNPEPPSFDVIQPRAVPAESVDAA